MKFLIALILLCSTTCGAYVDSRPIACNLNAMTAACVADVSGFDVIGSIRDEEGKGGEPLQNLLTRFGSRKPLQQLLQHQARRQDRFTVLNRLN